MNNDEWLIKEVKRVEQDLRTLNTDLQLVERQYQVQMSDKQKTVVIGEHEWKSLKNRIRDASQEMVENLNHFIGADRERQYHWSSLRLLTASSVLTAELRSYREKLQYIMRHPSNSSTDVHALANWIEAKIEPLCDRLNARLVQMIARVMDPEEWELSTTISDLSSAESAAVGLSLRFRPDTRERRKRDKALAKRQALLSLDD